jgi:hypothetical protein
MKTQNIFAKTLGKLTSLCLLAASSMFIMSSCTKPTDAVTPMATAIADGVPTVVADAFFAQYPTAAPITWKAIDGIAWEAQFKQTTDTLTAFVQDDGTFLDGGKTISVISLPNSIATYVAANMVGGTIKNAIIYQTNKAISGYKVVDQLANKTLAVASFDKNSTFLSSSPLYVMGKTDYFGIKPDSVSQANLLPAIQTYITANFGDYTFTKAFRQKNVDGTTKGFGVVLKATDGTSLAAIFDATGTFLKANKMVSRTNRIKPDTLSLNGLPSAIPTYLDANYPNYTFLKALSMKNPDSTVKGYLVRIMKMDSSKVGVSFDATGNFLKEVVAKAHMKPDSVSQANVPANITTYLTNTYPNYTFGKAFSVKDNTGNIADYAVIITSNSLTYSVVFDGQGNFIKATQITLPDMVQTADIPSGITAYINTTFVGATNLKVVRIKVDGNLVAYQARLKVGTTPHLLYFDATGAFTSEPTLTH